MMDHTRFYEKRKAGKPALGFMLQFASPDLVEFMGYLGLDYVFIDGEHQVFNLETIQSIARVCDLTGMFPIARVRRNEPAEILGFLEAGIKGITIPHVQNAEQARQAVSAVKFHPLGERSACPIARAARYGNKWGTAEYFEKTNRETIVIALLEDELGFQNATEILAVEGIDAIDFGPCDCSLSMGLPGQSNHPRVKEMIRNAKALARQAHKSFYAPVSSIADAKAAAAEGAGFIELSVNDVLREQYTSFIKMGAD
jgi:4-hydroxy-2-oxoheptanedioate aldolase